jgi:hypothetical protein
VGARLELDVFLSPPPGSAGRVVRIRTEATVIRVEHSGTVEGFAALSQDFTLLFDSNTRNAFCVSSVGSGGEGTPSG